MMITFRNIQVVSPDISKEQIFEEISLWEGRIEQVEKRGDEYYMHCSNVFIPSQHHRLYSKIDVLFRITKEDYDFVQSLCKKKGE